MTMLLTERQRKALASGSAYTRAKGTGSLVRWDLCFGDRYVDLTDWCNKNSHRVCGLREFQGPALLRTQLWVGRALNDALWYALVWSLGYRRIIITDDVEKVSNGPPAELAIILDDGETPRIREFVILRRPGFIREDNRFASETGKRSKLKRWTPTSPAGWPSPPEAVPGEHEIDGEDTEIAFFQGGLYRVPKLTALLYNRTGVFAVPEDAPRALDRTESFLGRPYTSGLLASLFYGQGHCRVTVALKSKTQAGGDHCFVPIYRDGWSDVVVSLDDLGPGPVTVAGIDRRTVPWQRYLQLSAKRSTNGSKVSSSASPVASAPVA